MRSIADVGLSSVTWSSGLV